LFSILKLHTFFSGGFGESIHATSVQFAPAVEDDFADFGFFGFFGDFGADAGSFFGFGAGDFAADSRGVRQGRAFVIIDDLGSDMGIAEMDS